MPRSVSRSKNRGPDASRWTLSHSGDLDFGGELSEPPGELWSQGSRAGAQRESTRGASQHPRPGSNLWCVVKSERVKGPILQAHIELGLDSIICPVLFNGTNQILVARAPLLISKPSPSLILRMQEPPSTKSRGRLGMRGIPTLPEARWRAWQARCSHDRCKRWDYYILRATVPKLWKTLGHVSGYWDEDPNVAASTSLFVEGKTRWVEWVVVGSHATTM